MTDPVAQADNDDLAMLAQVPAWVEQLGSLLDEEFEHLKRRDVQALETLHAPKTELLEQLSRVAAAVAAQEPKPEAWLAAQDKLQACGQAHFRNMNLMQRQLDAVRGALQALQGTPEASSVDLYDRMGQLSRRSGAWMYRLA